MRKINPRNLLLVLSIVCSVILLASIEACNNKYPEGEEGRKEMKSKPIEEVLKSHTDRLMAISGVAGTGQGLHEGKACIKVYVVKLTPELRKKIPGNIEGYPVIIEETGMFRSR